MSGIAGIVNFDSAPVSLEEIRTMLDAQAYRGPDKRGMWANGHVGLGHDLLRTVPEAEHETQPFSLDQSVWITADGRLDNRDDLIRALRYASGEPLDGVPDCHLMLLAYHHWGEDFAAHLVGDFALAIWDGRSRRLLCACDAVALRSLYYVVHRQKFIFGSSIGAVLAVLKEQPAPNELFIAQFLTQTLLDGRTATFYEGIQRLAPCHLLIVEAGRIRQKKYFEFGTGRQIRYATDQEYVDHFRELLEQALASCLRASTGISIQVSGGLDSSSLACLTDDLIENKRVMHSNMLTAFCMVTPNHPEMDERKFQDEVLKQCGHLEPKFFNSEPFWGFRSFGNDADYPFFQPEPHPMRSLILESSASVRESGNRIVLSGYGSDIVNGRISGYVADGSLLDLPCNTRRAEWAYFRRYYSARSLIFRGYVLPVVNPLLRGMPRKARYAQLVGHQYPHLNPKWLVGTYREHASDYKSFRPDLPSRAATLAHDWLMRGWECVWRSCTDTSLSFTQVEMRYPFLDRRLVDFVLQIPTRLLIHRGWDKWILREAIGERLPASARYRQRNVSASVLVNKGLRESEKWRIMELLSNSELIRRGWAKNKVWQSAWELYWSGATDSFAKLVAGISVEAWLRFYSRS